MNIQLDTILNLKYIEIQPFKVNFNDTINVTRLYVTSVNDNLIDQVILQYQLGDENSQIHYTQCIAMNGTDYQNWTGDNQFPFTFVLSQLPMLVALN